MKWMVPVITALKENRTLDLSGNQAVYEYLIEGGVDGIVLMGSMGEFFALSMEERKELIDLAAQTIQGKVPWIVGSSSINERETIALGNYAMDHGADAVMVMPPYYVPLNETEVEEYMGRVAEGIKGSILIYNYPARTGYDISPETAWKLAKKHGNILGYKDTVEDFSHTWKLIETMKEIPHFQIFSGFDHQGLQNVICGGSGSIGGLANVIPEVTSRFARAVRHQDWKTAVQVQRNLEEWMEVYHMTNTCIPTVKRAMQLRGLPIQSVCSIPFQPIQKGQEQELRRLMEDFLTKEGISPPAARSL